MTTIPHIRTDNLKQVVDLTGRIEAVIEKAKVQEGLCCLPGRVCCPPHRPVVRLSTLTEPI